MSDKITVIPGYLSMAICAMALHGCGAMPSVTYVKVTNDTTAQGVIDSVYPAESEITIDKVTDSKDKSAVTFSVTSKPVEMREYKIGFKTADSFGVKTKLNITKKENTDLLASIGVETIDERKKLVEQISGTLVKVIGLASAAAPGGCGVVSEGVKFPIVLRVSKDALATGNPIEFDADGTKLTSGSCIKVTPEKAPVDAVNDIPWGTSTSNFYYSSCRDATVEFRFAVMVNGKPVPTAVKKTTRIADPNKFQFVQFPYKGSITAHSQCGVSVKTESVQSDSTTAELIDAVAKAVKDVKDAADK